LDGFSQTLQDVLGRLDRAFRAFFEHRARYPRFKKFSQSGSFTYPQAYNGSAKPDALRKRLFLSKVGNVKAVFHRPLPKDTKLKTCTVVREVDGKWYACLVFEESELPMVEVPALWKSPIGIDLGLMSLVTTSDGEKVPHPKFLRRAEKRLKRLQRDFARKKNGSNNRLKAKLRLASQHSKVAGQRMDFNHKLSTRLVRTHDLVAFEDLQIGNMTQNHFLAKSIQDAGWGQLVRLAEYKAEKTGRKVVKVPAAHTTQECFFCSTLNNVALDVREFVCHGCGRTLDRDVNAAKIVLKRGLALIQVGRDTPELKPVETGPLPPRTTETASQVTEAGTTCGDRRASHIGVVDGSPHPFVAGGCHCSRIDSSSETADQRVTLAKEGMFGSWATSSSRLMALAALTATLCFRS
jgi:putative transposase